MSIKQEQKVIDLLSKIKSSNGGYPAELLAARRNQYIRQVANVGLGIGLGVGAQNTFKGLGNNGGTTAATITSKILETALIAAIAIEAGTVAYIYRDRIKDALQNHTSGPAATQVTSPVTDETVSQNQAQPQETIEPTTTATVTITVSPTGSVTPQPASTATSTQAANQNNNAGNPANPGSNVNATKPPKDNNGNQYGLTPKPERTKENGGNHNQDGDKDDDDHKNNGGNKKDK